MHSTKVTKIKKNDHLPEDIHPSIENHQNWVDIPKLPIVNSVSIYEKDSLYINKANDKPFSGLAKDYYFSETNPLEIVAIKSIVNYKNGKMDGVQENYTIKKKFKNGAIYKKGLKIKEIWNDKYLTERNGLLYRRHRTKPYTGEVREYYSGADVYKLKLHNQKMSQPNKFYKEALIQSPYLRKIYTVIDGKKEGYAETYFTNGSLRKQERYTNNELHGVVKTFTNAGISQIETYRSGIASKTVKWLDADGTKLFESNYKRGLFANLWPENIFSSLKIELLQTGQWFLRGHK